MKNIILISLWFTPIIVYSQPTSCGGLVNTGNNHTILLSNLSPGLDGNPFPTGAYIIVMFENENGQLTCGGFTEWTGVNTAIAAFGDDASTPEKDGF